VHGHCDRLWLAAGQRPDHRDHRRHGGWLYGRLAAAGQRPAAGLAVLVFELVRQHGMAMLGPILLLAGLLQLLAGRLRLGCWFRVTAPAVVYGMLAGIGVLIVLSQVHVMLDARPSPRVG
jgi:MFS superfamily sulfate permease-like transporter